MELFFFFGLNSCILSNEETNNSIALFTLYAGPLSTLISYKIIFLEPLILCFVLMWSMGMPSGTVVNAASSYSIHDSRRYRCLADRGGWFGLDPAFAYRGLQIEVSEVRDEKPWLEHPSIPEKNQFALEMDHFSECLLYNREPYTPGEEGLQDQKLMEAIYRSAKEKKVIPVERITKIDAFRGTPPKAES